MTGSICVTNLTSSVLMATGMKIDVLLYTSNVERGDFFVQMLSHQDRRDGFILSFSMLLCEIAGTPLIHIIKQI